MAAILKLLSQKFDHLSPYKPLPPVVYVKDEHYQEYRRWWRKNHAADHIFSQRNVYYRGVIIRPRSAKPQ